MSVFSRQRRPAKVQDSAKHRLVIRKILDGYLVPFPWLLDAPPVIHVHAHEGGDMKCLGVAIDAITSACLTIAPPENIRMLFQPGRVLNLGYNRLDRDAVGSKTVIQIEGTEIIAERT